MNWLIYVVFWNGLCLSDLIVLVGFKLGLLYENVDGGTNLLKFVEEKEKQVKPSDDKKWDQTVKK